MKSEGTGCRLRGSWEIFNKSSDLPYLPPTTLMTCLPHQRPQRYSPVWGGGASHAPGTGCRPKEPPGEGHWKQSEASW